MNKVYNSRLILIAATLVILNAAFGIAAQKVETTPPTREQAVTSPAAAFEYFKLCDEASTQKFALASKRILDTANHCLLDNHHMSLSLVVLTPECHTQK